MDTLQAIASNTSKLQALLKDSRKDLERIQALQNSLTETLDGLFDATRPNGDGHDVEPPAISAASDQKLWKGFVSLVASGRALGVSAQAEEALRVSRSDVGQPSWTADGKSYARWLAKGVVVLSTAEQPRRRQAQQLLGKSLGIGYANELVEIVTQMMVFDRGLDSEYYELIKALPSWEQRHFLTALITFLELRMSNKSAIIAGTDTTGITNGNAAGTERKRIAGAAALLKDLIRDAQSLQAELMEQLLSRPFTLPLVRASIAALPSDQLRTLMERSWNQFGDKLSIKHKPITQQESNVRLLLLTVGRVHQSNPMDVFVMARSSHHTNAISERLKSSSGRIRWLGMIVGTAISKIIDKGETKMDFGIEDMKTEEALWYIDLVQVEDRVGSTRDLVGSDTMSAMTITPGKPSNRTKTQVPHRNPVPATSKPKIVEVLSDSEEDDGLTPYTKPDSDASDSDEDPTLIDRNKPKAPVYIRDLLNMLADNETYTRQHLALQSATSLIRRKSDFGSELKDLAEELASTLVSMQDTFDSSDFHHLRQSALTALVSAQPKLLGPWAARMFFTADYSISQRATVLTAIGLAGRELAGLGSENTALVRMQQDREADTFPTKRLPTHLRRLYAEEPATSKEVDAISRQIEQTLLRPVATKQKSTPRPRTRILKNDLATIVGESFFFPLTGGWSSFSSPLASDASRSSLKDPTLLALLVKTLTILLTAAGRASAGLSQMVSELWGLLLSLRGRAMAHVPLMEAVLFGFLGMLDMCQGQTTVEKDANVLMETREWVAGVWEKLEGEGGQGMRGLGEVGGVLKGSGDSGGEEVQRCKYLAAGVLVRIQEIGDEYQRVLKGRMGGA